jgi:hypothetical protein
MSKRIPPIDLMFLLTESANGPKHVGAFLPFKLPPGGGARVAREIVEAYRAAQPLPPFNFVPDLALAELPRWKIAERMDMRYHVQHLALPAGSTDNDLRRLIEDLHEPVLDRNRPGFRIYVIEGLPGNRFALYLKIHHAIVDGKSAMMRILASMNPDPGSRRMAPFFAVDLASEKPKPPGPLLKKIVSLQTKLRTQASAVTSLYLGVLNKRLGGLLSRELTGSVPFTAPRTPMNEPIRSSRTFAMLSLPLAEMPSPTCGKRRVRCRRSPPPRCRLAVARASAPAPRRRRRGHHPQHPGRRLDLPRRRGQGAGDRELEDDARALPELLQGPGHRAGRHH